MSSSPDPSSRPPINLSRVTERTRRQLYDVVCSVFFERGDTTRTYSPDEAGVVVLHFWGRWFTGWEDLDAAPDLSERARRQLMVIERAKAVTGGPGGYGLEFSEC
jgi:hypothetical protein